MQISFSGDICPYGSYEQCFIDGNVDRQMPEIIKQLRKSDLHIANLELPVSTGGEPIIKCGPNFRSSPAIIRGLKQLKVSHACLANNHIKDYGEEALLDTVRHLENQGIKALGVAKGEDALMKPFFFEQDGVKLCLINAAEAEFSLPTRDSWGASMLNEVAIINMLHLAREQTDVIFLSLHAGREYRFFPASFLRKMYHNFIDAGADAIIGHHPHVPQGIEIYKEKLICYSLGNFIFDRPGMRKKIGPEFTFLLNCEINKEGIKSHSIVPLERNPDNTMTLLQGERKKNFMDFMQLISEPLYDEALATRLWDEYVREDVDLYMTHLAKAYNAYPFDQSEEADEQKAYLLNVNSSCLSHQKMLERIIQLVTGNNTKSDQYAVSQINDWKNILNKLRKKQN
jgi:Bacterial capsule synthesis protein PGA_cap